MLAIMGSITLFYADSFSFNHDIHSFIVHIVIIRCVQRRFGGEGTTVASNLIQVRHVIPHLTKVQIKYKSCHQIDAPNPIPYDNKIHIFPFGAAVGEGEEEVGKEKRIGEEME
jgi:hypothetical protein